jgi:signal transduction histidine kinase
MSRARSKIEDRILIVAPTGADAENSRKLLRDVGFVSLICSDIRQAVTKIGDGCGTLLMTEEALIPSHSSDLAKFLEAQPRWSDLPIVVITSTGGTNEATMAAVALLGPLSNVTLVERPLNTSTLIATLKAASRARGRQYEIRGLLEERDRLLASLEKRVAERTTKLQETVSELEAFSYSISHDLRAPLRAMQSFATILAEESADRINPQGQDCIRRIVTSAARMDQLIQDILSYSRVAHTDLTLQRVDLNELTRGIIESYPQFNAPFARIVVSGKLPCVRGNQAALTQCISNLLSNAVKFMDPKVTPHVRIRATKNSRHVRLFVADNGIGIPHNARKKIFGIFQQMDKGYEGTGIGLAIVRKAMDRMGGRITLESRLGRGSTFCLELKRDDTP